MGNNNFGKKWKYCFLLSLVQFQLIPRNSAVAAPEEHEQDKYTFTKNNPEFYDGLWPMSNRRYLVSWIPKNVSDAKALCESNKMKLYEPSRDDECLIQNLKNWMTNVTSYSFWTSGYYDVGKRRFYHANDSAIEEEVANGWSSGNGTNKDRINTEHEHGPKDTICSAMSWNNHLYHDHINHCQNNCSLVSFHLSPEDCEKHIGVICQHLGSNEDDQIPCTSEYVSFPSTPGFYHRDDENLKMSNKQYEFYNFDEDLQSEFVRSAFKQPGNNYVCPMGYKRATQLSNYFDNYNLTNSSYPYDYTTPYWVKSIKDSSTGQRKCQLSRVTYNVQTQSIVRELKNEDCDRWSGFILCQRSCKTGKVNGTCPSNNLELHRLGKTRFYILQKGLTKGNHTSMYVTWQRGRELCRRYGLKLAKIDNLPTDVYVGRALEEFLTPLEWEENYYWIDAKFDESRRTYVWEDTKESINYANFFYHGKRPKGYGNLYSKTGEPVSNPKDRVPHCLALALPLVLNKVYGMHTTFYERHCNYKRKSNVLCESEDPVCEEEQLNSIFTQTNTEYYDGVWPMSHRRFVVSWTPKSFKEAKEFCTDNKMTLYEPHTEDDCLVHNLKNWMRKVTSYSFWTGGYYKVKNGVFYHANNTPVAHLTGNIQFAEEEGTEMNDPDLIRTCTTMTWNNEIPSDNKNFCNCSFNSMNLSPENCRHRLGVICQHDDSYQKPCTHEFITKQLRPGNYSAADDVAKFKEFYNFDESADGKFKRSAYKQRGDQGPCPTGYRRVNKQTQYWGTVQEYLASNYPYDYTTPYWMKPSKNKSGKLKCEISLVSFDKEKNILVREINEVDCSKWMGFVICEINNSGAIKSAN